TPSLESIYSIPMDSVDQALDRPETPEDDEAADFANDELSPDADEEDTTDETDEGEPAQWTRRFAELEPKVALALREKRGDGSKIRTVLAFAQEKAEAQSFGPALQALDRLEPLLEIALAPRAPSAAAPADSAARAARPAAGSPADFPRLWETAK